MNGRLGRLARRWWPLAALVAFVGAYWLLPISGQVLIIPGRQAVNLTWPQMRMDPLQPSQQATLWVTDVEPWAHVLVTVDGHAVYPQRWWRNPGQTWTWQWPLGSAEPGSPSLEGATIVFYRDCHTGCRERGRVSVGGSKPAGAATEATLLPTKLGAVFANPERDWHGRSGWTVELTYARLPEEPHWGIDGLAARAQAAAARGLRVLVRVDYDRGQSLPPAGDYQALSEYLAYVRRLARDDRLDALHGLIIGSGFNARDANSQAPGRPVTPRWYARLFNGSGEPVTRSDNVVQTVRAENPQLEVLVGPVRPWCSDQDGQPLRNADAPWLNYMNELVAALDEGATARSAVGIALAAPDGFAVQAPGRPDAPELAGRSGAEEPRLDLPREAWGGAQAGFRVYRDWLAIVNDYPATRGLPLYITSTNTYAADEGVPPAQSYVRGWLPAALDEINREPQVQALCWYIDGPLDDTQWDGFSLARRQGHMAEAADEFDALLRGER